MLYLFTGQKALRHWLRNATRVPENPGNPDHIETRKPWFLYFGLYGSGLVGLRLPAVGGFLKNDYCIRHKHNEYLSLCSCVGAEHSRGMDNHCNGISYYLAISKLHRGCRWQVSPHKAPYSLRLSILQLQEILQHKSDGGCRRLLQIYIRQYRCTGFGQWCCRVQCFKLR